MSNANYESRSTKPVGGTRYEVFYWYYVRLSGLLLVFLALFHLWLNHINTDVGDLTYQLVMERMQDYPVLRVVDFLLLFLGLGHGVLGLKALIDDYVHNPKTRFLWLTVLLVAFSVFMVVGTTVLWTFEA